jgi:hypothetical protein
MPFRDGVACEMEVRPAKVIMDPLISIKAILTVELGV